MPGNEQVLAGWDGPRGPIQGLGASPDHGGAPVPVLGLPGAVVAPGATNGQPGHLGPLWGAQRASARLGLLVDLPIRLPVIYL